MLDKKNFISKSKMKGRTRNFSVVLYPENLDDDFLQAIEKSQVKCVLSPLHNQDIDDMGEIKKEHYHFIFSFDSVKEPYQAYEYLCNTFGEKAFSVFQKVNSMTSSVRYLCHLDSDDEKKFKYDIQDLKAFNGFNLSKYLYSECDKVTTIKKIRAIIKDYNFVIFDDLFQYCEDNNDDELLNTLLTDCDIRATTFEILRSREYRRKMEMSGIDVPRYYKSASTEKVMFNRQLKQA